MSRHSISSNMLQGAEYGALDKLEADIKHYQDPLFDRFRGFRTTVDPHSLQNIILRKQREMLRVTNYAKRLQEYRFTWGRGQPFNFRDFKCYMLHNYPDDLIENDEKLEEYTKKKKSSVLVWLLQIYCVTSHSS